MRLHNSAWFIIGAVAACSFGPLRAQTLGELARKEEARRKAAKAASPEPARVYTNKDVGDVPAPVLTPPAASPTDGTKPAAPGQEPASPAREPGAPAAAADATPGGTGPVKDQAYWSGRIASMRAQLNRNRTYADALQSRVNALTTDFVNQDDPARRAVIDADRQRAIAELDRLQKQIVDEQTAIADLEEEARRAGVPPGWLR